MPIRRARSLYKKYERWVPIATFLIGFVFDMLMLNRIDEPAVILQQAVYLLIAALMIGVELVEQSREVQAPRLFSRVWLYREAFLHFLLGALLNSYAIFYFKSASAFSSLFFILLLVVLLTLNEFKRFGKAQTQVHVMFLSLCVISFLASLVPTLLGFIGTIPFLIAVAGSFAVLAGYRAILKPRLRTHPRLLLTHLVYPFALIQIVFIALYFAHLIPPVPLSVKYLGIYHGIQKTDEGYALTYTRSKWKFWQHGDQTFMARPGDVVHCYAQIFSPTRFKDRLQIRWLYEDPKHGWQSSDAIPIAVTGGREEGFRAATQKSNFQPGDWRVQIETLDSQEIGRIGFTVVADDSTDARELHTEIR